MVSEKVFELFYRTAFDNMFVAVNLSMC